MDKDLDEPVQPGYDSRLSEDFLQSRSRVQSLEEIVYKLEVENEALKEDKKRLNNLLASGAEAPRINQEDYDSTSMSEDEGLPVPLPPLKYCEMGGVLNICENPGAGSYSQIWRLATAEEKASYEVEQKDEVERKSKKAKVSNVHETLDSSMDLLRVVARQNKILRAKVERPRDKAVAILESQVAGEKAMAGVTIKKKDKDHEREKEQMRQAHTAEIKQLKAEKKAAQIIAEKNKDDTFVRNGFHATVKRHDQEMRKLCDEKDGIAAELKLEKELKKNNSDAQEAQKRELKQARNDLLDFEKVKTDLRNLQTEHQNLKTMVDNGTEIRDIKVKYETEIAKLKRLLESEKKNSANSLAETNRHAAKLETANAELQTLEITAQQATEAFNELRKEYWNRVGEAPGTVVING